MSPAFLTVIRAFSKRRRRHPDDGGAAQSPSMWLQLPTEIWLKVFAFLDKTDIASFSRTSRAMRSISLPRLFVSLRLRVGYNILDNHSKEKENEHVQLAKKSIVTLRRLAEQKPMLGVTHTPNELVQNLCIVSGVDIKSKHIEILLPAMWKLYNLRRLAWVGGTFPWEVAGVVAVSCTELVTLQITSIVDHPLRQLSALGAKLRDIQFMDDCVAPCPSNRNLRILFHQTCGLQLVKLLTQRNQEYIRKLSVYGPDPWASEPQLRDLFTGPTHIVDLAISGPNVPPGIREFLLQSPALESLALLDMYFLTFLPLGENILSNLKHLKVHISTSTPQYPVLTISDPLTKFVGLHPHLRRFDLSFCMNAQLGSGHEMREEERSWVEGPWFSDVINAISELEDLRALGITLPFLAKDQVTNALNILSDRFRSFETCNALRIEGTQDAPMEPVLARFSNCKFAALSDSPHCHCSFAEVRPRLLTVAQVLCHCGLDKLEQLILNDTIYDIYRGGISTEAGMTAKRWAQSRVRWRTEADFCTPDAHWLMSYRTIWNGNVAGLSSLPLF